jgi:fluoride exporter
MTEAIFVSIGGFLGAISRFTVSKKIQNKFISKFPIGTLIVNVLGAFLLGLLVGMKIKGNLYSLIAIGFMGAFTTFSTLNLEADQLRKENKKIYFSYLTISYSVGISLAFCGFIIGKAI